MSENNSNRWPDPPGEGEYYDPKLHEELRSSKNKATACGIVVGIILLFSFILGPSTEWLSVVVFFIGLIPVAIVFNIWNSQYQKKIAQFKSNIEITKMKDSQQMKTDIEDAKKELGETHMMLKEQKDTLNKLQSAQRTGDIIISGNKAPVVIDSQIVNSFNSIVKDDPELASAIKTLGGYIEDSGNREAAEYYGELHNKIADGESNKTVLKALWTGIVNALPGVEKLTEVVTKITALFI